MEIAKYTRILIIGRGPSARHFNYSQLSTDIMTIGLNVREVDGYVFSEFIDNERIEFLCKQSSIQSLKVGSVTFKLGILLTYLDNKAKTKLDIGLVGFDFDGYSIDDDIDKVSSTFQAQRRLDISSQQTALFNMMPSLNKISVVRFGFDQFADLDPRLPWATSKYRRSSEVEIVAEITTNHHGDTNRLLMLIEGAATAGANSVKLQRRDVDTFYSDQKLKEAFISPFGSTFRDYRIALELSEKQIQEARHLAKELGLNLFFSTLDVKSYEWARYHGFERVKLPSTISNKRLLLETVSRNPTRELVISTGMTNKDYENWIIANFKDIEKLYFLQCTSSYPTFYRDINIGVVSHYKYLSKKYTNIVPGLSSHDFGSTGSVMAVAAGAKMIEKHIKVGVNNWSHFDDTALDVQTAFVDFVRDVRNAEEIYGSEEKRVLDAEHHKY